MTIQELRNVIARINAEQDFDLAWRWDGTEDKPYVLIYEEADRHELCAGSLDVIEERLRNALPFWGLEYPDDSTDV